MSQTLTAQDLWPLIQKLSHDEQVRLARLALRAAARSSSSDADAYRAAPPSVEEFSSYEDPLAWDAEGFES